MVEYDDHGKMLQVHFAGHTLPKDLQEASRQMLQSWKKGRFAALAASRSAKSPPLKMPLEGMKFVF